MADAPPKTQINSASQISSDHANPSNFFLYKAALVTAFLVLLPLFPSLAPDFMNQSLHARSWELLQLIFVGIAVSYGLFSKKNEESHKDNPISKMDNAQSYVSKLLQVSSVFDDDSDTHTVIEDSSKFQALNSQYYRGQPVVVVAKENPAIEETNGVVSQINQKPLLLPVRSLKQRVPSPNQSSSRAGSTKMNTSSKKSRDEEENVVLRSPIPWRSRSGRMEMNEDGDQIASLISASPSMEEQELNRLESRSFRSQSKKSFASPPPAPPPPPPPPPPPSSSAPPFLRKPVLMKSSSSIGSKPNAGLAEEVLRRSVRSVPNEEEVRVAVRNSDVLMKSVRTFRPNEVEKESNDYEMKFVDKRGTVQSYTAEEEEEEEEEFQDKAVVETMEEEDRFEESSSGNVGGAADVGPDVDKKADEFIAKFREQIRLQRIESIRRSTAQRAGKPLR